MLRIASLDLDDKSDIDMEHADAVIVSGKNEGI
jgi:hypothetical protein